MIKRKKRFRKPTRAYTYQEKFVMPYGMNPMSVEQAERILASFGSTPIREHRHELVPHGTITGRFTRSEPEMQEVRPRGVTLDDFKMVTVFVGDYADLERSYIAYYGELAKEAKK